MNATVISIDEHTRARATSSVDVSFALSAGAGAGKTRVLVDRVAALLAAGRDPKRIAVITFTERAAGEVQERVHDRCEARFAETGDLNLARALGRLADLTVATIHAFAGDLLRAEAFEASWTPDAELVAEGLSTSAVDAAYRRWRLDFDERHPAVAATVRERAREQTLRRAALELLRFRDLEPLCGPEALDYGAMRKRFDDARLRLETLRAGCVRPQTCKLVAGTADLLAALVAAAGEPDDRAAFAAYSKAPNGELRGGSAKDWPGDGHKTFKEAVGAFRELRDGFAKAELIPIHREVVLDLRDHFLGLVEEEKRARSQYDFDDLLFRCAALLGGRETARARLAARFDAILVDEVQDTDPIQAEIVALLTRDPQAAGNWLSHPPRSGALFAVGDPKQSIYRFRRADLATWRDLESLIGKNGERAALSRCFRSVPGIVAFANHVFAGLPDFAPLEATRGPGELDPVVVLRADPEEETAAAVRHVVELVTSRRKIRDRGELRPVEYRDVMILLPAWGRADAVQEAFHSAGVDCIVEGGAKLFDRDEVRLAIAAMKAIEEPGDGEAVVFVLRGIFGLSHAELAEHRASGGAWRYTIGEQPPGPAAEAFALLRRLHWDRARAGWCAILDELLERTRAPAVWSLTARGRSMLANLEKLKALIRQLEPAARAPADIVRRIEALAARGDEQDLPVSDPDANAVRVTTLFKAKGLEAPVVVILHANRRDQGQMAIVDRERRTVAIDIGDLEPPDMDAIKAREKIARADEKRRWMYVAATRAADQLVIAATSRSNLLETEDFERVFSGIETAAHETLVDLGGGVRVRVRDGGALPELAEVDETFPGLDAAVDRLLADPPAGGDPAGDERARVISERVRAAKTRCTRWASVTEWVRPLRKRSAGVGATGGRVIHAVMEALDLARSRAELEVDVPGLVRAHAVDQGLDDALVEPCISVVRRILEDELLDRARAAPERWQEVSFAFPEAEGIVSGTIDLCFPTDETRKRWVVVDWKSDLAPPGSPLRAAYKRQLATYVEALVHNLAGVRPEDVECALVGPHPELRAETAAEALAEVHEALRDGLEVMLDAGQVAPAVGLDVGTPIFAQLELAFETRRVGLLLDGSPEQVTRLEAEGWSVIVADTGEVDWAERALAALATRLDGEPS